MPDWRRMSLPLRPVTVLSSFLLWLSACGSAPPVAPAALPVALPAATPVATPAAAAVPTAPAALGTYPFCEPSALLPLEDGSLLIADNEGQPASEKDDLRPPLWLSVLNGTQAQSPTSLSTNVQKQDIESLLRVGDQLWVIGSFSRNKDCKVRPERRQIQIFQPSTFSTSALQSPLPPPQILKVAAPNSDDTAAWALIESSVEACKTGLFSPPELGTAVCTALVAATQQQSPCGTLNIEGAVTLQGRAWLGLRAPLVDQKAVMLRVAPGNVLRFDAVQLLDLKGQGIRELGVEKEKLYGIAGDVLEIPGQDPLPSAFFRFPLSDLTQPEWLYRDLPSSTESFRLFGENVLFLVDGRISKDNASSCEIAAKQFVRPLKP